MGYLTEAVKHVSAATILELDGNSIRAVLKQLLRVSTSETSSIAVRPGDLGHISFGSHKLTLC